MSFSGFADQSLKIIYIIYFKCVFLQPGEVSAIVVTCDLKLKG